ncbi:hypothetical protein PF002_g30441 [Phytophthora fragariae]|uniref:Uncharacterized protein n=1 Tax=Phytophthora fragariae TaxID=53985 RepID=A0A6A3VKP8_9STRA|nr:hypothetical protein PF002_g30441 [Phytophthora fragariae]
MSVNQMWTGRAIALHAFACSSATAAKKMMLPSEANFGRMFMAAMMRGGGGG